MSAPTEARVRETARQSGVTIASWLDDTHLLIVSPGRSPVDDIRDGERGSGEHDRDVGAEDEHVERVPTEQVVQLHDYRRLFLLHLFNRLIDVARSRLVQAKDAAAVMQPVRKLGFVGRHYHSVNTKDPAITPESVSTRGHVDNA